MSKILFILIFFLHFFTSIITSTANNNNQFYKKFNLNKKFLQNANLKFKILLNPPDDINLNGGSKEELVFDRYELESINDLNNTLKAAPVVLLPRPPVPAIKNEITTEYVKNSLIKIVLVYRTRYEFNFELTFASSKNIAFIYDKTLRFKFSFYSNANRDTIINYFYVIDFITNEYIYKLSVLPSIKSKFDTANDEITMQSSVFDDSSDDELIYYYFKAYVDRYATRNELLAERKDEDEESGGSDLTIDLNRFQRILELNSFLLNGNFNDTSSLFKQSTQISDYTIGCIDPIYPDSDVNAMLYGDDGYDDRHLCKLNLFNLLIINDFNYLKIQINKNLLDYKFKLNYLNLILYIRKTMNIYNKLETPNIVYINVRINLIVNRKMNLNLMNYIQSRSRNEQRFIKRQQQQQLNSVDEENTLFEVNNNVNGGVISVGHKSQTFYSSVLAPLQLVINEDTIGLQTKVKLYDYIWHDYQLNASDYVKERIQLISPDNSMLNISKRFDYETGGPLHSFQIIFFRKLDKRTSECFLFFQ